MTGYLKLSISVLGPKDKPKIHDPEEDERKEREAGADQTLCLMPPSIKRFTQFLVRQRCQPRGGSTYGCTAPISAHHECG